jgi:hypothetical protein
MRILLVQTNQILLRFFPYEDPVIKYLSLLLLTVALLGCKSNATNPENPAPALLTVFGTIDNPRGIAIPDGAKVVVLWSVDGSPDYAYIFGEGVLTANKNSFAVSLSEVPPDTTLNGRRTIEGESSYYRLGVGIVILVHDPNNVLATSRRVTSELPEGVAFLGAVEQQAIIYGLGAARTGSRVWMQDFPSGYSVGQGEKRPGMHDKFVPTSPTQLRMRVETDIREMRFVNWA